MNTVFNRAPYLRTSRKFPEELQQLTIEIDKSYIDIADKVNVRTIGIFTTSAQDITGEAWYLNSTSKQQSIRQVYTFGKVTAGVNLSIPHGIKFANISNFVRIWGTFFDGTNYYPLPYVNPTNTTLSMGLFVTPTNIVIEPGAAATAASGIVVLEWLADV